VKETFENCDTSLMEIKKKESEKLLLMPAIPSCQHLGAFFIPPEIHRISLPPTLPLLNFATALTVAREKSHFSFLSSSSMGKVLARGR
jgi:hypothetical protein